MQYIDERAVMRDHQVDAKADDNQMGKDYYYLLQELYTVGGLADCRGWLAEMYTYQAYGDAQIWDWAEGDLNRDGTADSLDNQSVSAGVGEGLDPLLDKNLDGVVAAYQDWVSYQQTFEAYATTVGNPYLFTGRTTELVHTETRNSAYPTTSVTGTRRLQDNRNRTYDPKHGRWLQRDPMGVRPSHLGKASPKSQYAEGMSLYQYVRSRPCSVRDPHGLTGQHEVSCVQQDDEVPPYEYCVKELEHGIHYMDWVERAESPWQTMAEGKLDHCPERLELPFRVEAALQRTNLLTQRYDWEYCGALTYLGAEPTQHRVWGPNRGGFQTKCICSASVPTRLQGPDGPWTIYGGYHAHMGSGESFLSLPDVKTVLQARRSIQIMRNCSCTLAIVLRHDTKPWKEIEKLGLEYMEEGHVVPSDKSSNEEAREQEARLIKYANRYNFCYYKNCDQISQRVLRRQNGGG